jgi:hypothetical protein
MGGDDGHRTTVGGHDDAALDLARVLWGAAGLRGLLAAEAKPGLPSPAGVFMMKLRVGGQYRLSMGTEVSPIAFGRLNRRRLSEPMRLPRPAPPWSRAPCSAPTVLVMNGPGR